SILDLDRKGLFTLVDVRDLTRREPGPGNLHARALHLVLKFAGEASRGCGCGAVVSCAAPLSPQAIRLIRRCSIPPGADDNTRSRGGWLPGFLTAARRFSTRRWQECSHGNLARQAAHVDVIFTARSRVQIDTVATHAGRVPENARRRCRCRFCPSACGAYGFR